MKKLTGSQSAFWFLFSGLFLLSLSSAGQEALMSSPPLPENINRIISFSCMPCHGSTGGIMAKSKLNFAEWTKYTPEKQKEKAEEIYSEMEKGKMPPKNARESRPEIIPTKDQIDVIRKWSESFAPKSK